MDLSSFVGPAVVAAVVSGIIATVGMFVNRATTIRVHEDKLKPDRDLAERKFDFDRDLAERKATADIALAEKKV